MHPTTYQTTNAEPIHGFSEEDLIRQKCMQNDIMKNHPDYTGEQASQRVNECMGEWVNVACGTISVCLRLQWCIVCGLCRYNKLF